MHIVQVVLRYHGAGRPPSQALHGSVAPAHDPSDSSHARHHPTGTLAASAAATTATTTTSSSAAAYAAAGVPSLGARFRIRWLLPTDAATFIPRVSKPSAGSAERAASASTAAAQPAQPVQPTNAASDRPYAGGATEACRSRVTAAHGRALIIPVACAQCTYKIPCRLPSRD